MNSSFFTSRVHRNSHTFHNVLQLQIGVAGGWSKLIEVKYVEGELSLLDLLTALKLLVQKCEDKIQTESE